MIQKKHIKKITTFLLLLVTVLTLVACSKKENVPYGDISDDVYLSLDEVNVTEKEVYDGIRRQSGGKISKIIEEKLFDSYKAKVNDLLDETNPEEGTLAHWAQEEFDKEVNNDIFSTNDIDAIKKFRDFELSIAKEKFLDSLFVENSAVNLEKIKDELDNILNDSEEEDYARGYFELDEFREIYNIYIQQKLYVKEILDEDVLDEDGDHFIKETDVIKHYKDKVKGRHDANIFAFPFLNLNEANAALRMLSIKSNSRGHWFEIPDIRLTETIENNPESDNEYLWSVIEKVNLTEKVNETNDDNSDLTKITEVEYKKFYEAYSISESRDTKLLPEEVFAYFIDLYNIVNDDKLVEVNPNDIDASDLINYQVLHENGNEFKTNFDYDELGEIGSSLRTYVYDTLTEEKPYSTLRSVGGFRYLIFKLDENYNELNFESPEKDEDDKSKWVTIDEIKELLEDEDKGQDLLDALKDIDGIVNNDEVDFDALEDYMNEQISNWKEEIKNNKLTSSYVNNKLSEVYEDAKIEIYDNLIRILFNQSNELEAKGKNKAGSVVLSFSAKLNDEKVSFEITADELFERLEKEYGLETAIDLVINKYLLNEYKKKDGMFKDEEIDVKEYKKELKDLINNFSNDGFAEAGYPSSLGRESFLIMLFGTTDLDEAVELGYIVPELRDIYLNNYEENLNVDVYETLSTYSKRQHDLFKGLSVSHLLVYFDTDGDDKPENPHEYFETLTDEQVLELKELIIELYDLILHEIGQDGLSEEKIKAVVEEYQSYARIPLGNYKPEKWEKFRKAGINLKYESIGSDITNTSNFATGDSVLDEVFYNRAIALHDLIMEDRNEDDEKLVDDGLPYLDYAGSLNIVQDPDILDKVEDDVYVNLEELISNFGVHFIMVNSISDKLSAKYDAEDDRDEDYLVEIDGKEYSAYNEDSETITKEQIEYYIKGNELEDGILLPSKVRQAFNKYFDPIYELFRSDVMSVEILNELFVTHNADFKGKEDRFNHLRKVNRNQFHKYLLGHDENYDAIYGDWFDEFGLTS